MQQGQICSDPADKLHANGEISLRPEQRQRDGRLAGRILKIREAPEVAEPLAVAALILIPGVEPAERYRRADQGWCQHQIIVLMKVGDDPRGAMQDLRGLHVFGAADPPAVLESLAGRRLDVIRRKFTTQRLQPRVNLVRHVRRNDDAGGMEKFHPVEFRARFLHLMAQGFAQGRRMSGRLHTGRIGIDAGQRRQFQGDAQGARSVRAGPQIGGPIESRREVRITLHGPVGRIEKRSAVAHRSRDDMSDGHTAPAFTDVRTHRGAGAGRLQTDQPAARRGNPNGPAPVRCMGRRYDPRGNRRASTAARATGGVFEVPRVAAGSVERRFGGGGESKLRRIGASEQQQAGVTVAPDQFGIVIGDEVRE